MKILGFEITRPRAKSLSAVDATGSGWGSGAGWFPVVREGFAGAWQSSVVVNGPRELLSFSAVYACVSLIAEDIAKLCLELTSENADGVDAEVPDASPYWSVLRKPNDFQTTFQFVVQWLGSKLLTGNTFALKERDGRGIVQRMYVLDPRKVTPLVAEDGSVYYRLARDDIANVPQPDTLPASEIMHDRMPCLWHPLVGVSPIYACAASAVLGSGIQNDSARFFKNASMPSGGLTAPGHIDNETAERLKKQFEERYGGGGIGRIFVAGDGLQFTPLRMTSADAQLIEQLKFSVEDVARAFRVPLYKLGGEVPPRMAVEDINQLYYTDCLQAPMTSMEKVLDDGLGLTAAGYEAKFDVDDLLRMNGPTRYKMISDGVGGGWLKPDEGRAREGFAKVPGGDTPYLQQQYYSLAALADRDSQGFQPAGGAAPSKEPPAKPTPLASDASDALLTVMREVSARLREPVTVRIEAPQPSADEVSDESVVAFFKTIQDGLHEAA